MTQHTPQHPPQHPHFPARQRPWGFVLRLLRHRWAQLNPRPVLAPAQRQRLGQRVADSERRHSGQIRICVETGLPLSYLWRGASARERAITQFGKLRVWDTQDNNGVLIYLLLAEHAIEIVADRGLTQRVPAATWSTLVTGMGAAFRAGQYEQGLSEALAAASALLEEHFPAQAGDAARPNELPDAPVLL